MSLFKLHVNFFLIFVVCLAVNNIFILLGKNHNQKKRLSYFFYFSILKEAHQKLKVQDENIKQEYEHSKKVTEQLNQCKSPFILFSFQI